MLFTPKNRLKRYDLPELQLVGWRVEFRTFRVRICRFFSDSAYGGNRLAKKAAKEFIAKNAANVGEVLKLLRRLEPRSTTRFEMTGISRIEAKNGSKFWVAYWDDETGRKVQKKFSIRLHGEQEAKRLAVAARKHGVADYAKRLNRLKKEFQLK